MHPLISLWKHQRALKGRYDGWQMLVMEADISCNYFDNPSPCVQCAQSARKWQRWAHHCCVNSLWLSKTCYLLQHLQQHKDSTVHPYPVQLSLTWLLYQDVFSFTHFLYWDARWPCCLLWQILSCLICLSQQRTGDWHVHKQASTQRGTFFLSFSLHEALSQCQSCLVVAPLQILQLWPDGQDLSLLLHECVELEYPRNERSK